MAINNLNNRKKNKPLSASRRVVLKDFSRVGIVILLGATVIATYNGQRKVETSTPEKIDEENSKLLGDSIIILDGWVLNK